MGLEANALLISLLFLTLAASLLGLFPHSLFIFHSSCSPLVSAFLAWPMPRPLTAPITVWSGRKCRCFLNSVSSFPFLRHHDFLLQCNFVRGGGEVMMRKPSLFFFFFLVLLEGVCTSRGRQRENDRALPWGHGHAAIPPPPCSS